VGAQSPCQALVTTECESAMHDALALQLTDS